jgi:hypothetical protein
VGTVGTVDTVEIVEIVNMPDNAEMADIADNAVVAGLPQISDFAQGVIARHPDHRMCLPHMIVDLEIYFKRFLSHEQSSKYLF